MEAMIILFALIGPFLLWPIEHFLPYPHVVEELFKFVLIYKLIDHVHGKKILVYAVVIGVGFAASETVLYIFNIFLGGGASLFVKRLFVTSILHTSTTLIIALSSMKGKRLMVVGLVVAIFVHYTYNIRIAM